MRPYVIGNGLCNGWDANTEECGYDGGDCIEFNEKYPNCNVYSPYEVGDGRCDSSNGDDVNTEECGYDGGDCIEFNEKYPDCKVNFPYEVGDGKCNGGKYNTKECGYDGGDCIDFNIGLVWLGMGFVMAVYITLKTALNSIRNIPSVQ